MRCFVFVCLAVVFMMFCYNVNAHEEETPFDELNLTQRIIGIGIDGLNDDLSLSATVVVPVRVKKIEGWVGGFAQQQSNDGDVTSQLINGHTVLGYKLSERFTINSFADYLRDKDRGIDSQVQLGGFLSADLIDTNTFHLSAGAGNFVENQQARDDLDLKETDPNVLRFLAYAKAAYGRYSIIQRITPQVDLSDIRIELEPTGSWSLGEKASLVAKLRFIYESHPIIEDKYTSSAFQIQWQSRF